MWYEKKVSVVFPAYNEEQNIQSAVEDFFAGGVVDEIIVVNNNSKDRTLEQAQKTKAIVVTEYKQGYGSALQRGLREATGDLIILAEPDGTFRASDVTRLLVYSNDYEVVFGSRTNTAAIGQDAYMSGIIRWGNIIVGKMLSYRHGGPSLTDVGCTMRLISRSALTQIIDKFQQTSPVFSPEFMIVAIRNRLKCIEIPLTYMSRIGESKLTGTFSKAFKLGLKMIFLILTYRESASTYQNKD